MKVTALDNVTCKDMGLNLSEDADQLRDLLEEAEQEILNRYGHVPGKDYQQVEEKLLTAWRRGIAFALAGKVERTVICSCGRQWPTGEHCDPDYEGKHTNPCCR